MDKINYCKKSGLALTTAFQDTMFEELKSWCKIAKIPKTQQKRKLETLHKELDKWLKDENPGCFHTEFKKNDSEYNNTVKAWKENKEIEN